MSEFSFLAPEAAGEQRPGAPPTFSVLIAAYQSAATVAEAVESALGQTAPPDEVVVVDDGSTDDIEGALEPYLRRIVFRRKENGGEASAKNLAACTAAGEFVVILDADDLFLSERIEALGRLAAARPDLDILTTDAYLEVDGRVVRRCYEGGMRFVVDDQRRGILRQNFVFGLAAVRRSALLEAGGFDEHIRWTTDWDCWIRLILSGSRVGLVDAPLARYRLVPGSLSAQRARLIGGRLATLEKAERRTDLSGAERAVLESSLAENRRLLLLAEAREAVLEGRQDVRGRSLAVAFGEGFGVLTRAKALASAVAPRSAGRMLAGHECETTGGVRVRP
jgi:glycosyltransferase involved in cell wall biosynthesis